MPACVITYKPKTQANAAQALAERLIRAFPAMVAEVMKVGGVEIDAHKDLCVRLVRGSVMDYNVPDLEAVINTGRGEDDCVFKRRVEMRARLIHLLNTWMSRQPEREHLEEHDGDIRFIDMCGANMDSRTLTIRSSWGPEIK